MDRIRMLLLSTLLLGALASGCGSDPGAVDPPEPAARSHGAGPAGLVLPEERPADDYPMSDPPRFHVLTEDGQVDLRPWTICGPGYCADGAPDDRDLVDVGAVDHLDFGFDLSGWEFRDVTFRELREDCPRAITVEATRTGERTFRIDPVGPAGRWAVDIFGRGPDGDAVTTVEWTTGVDGPDGPPPKGVAAVVAGHDGTLDSYGVELSLDGLDAQYGDAQATLEVASASGGTVTIPLRLEPGCGYEGQLFFTASEERGRAAAALGEPPFTYTARVVLDGTTHSGTGVWPADEIRGYAPNVRLRWDPPLPAYDGQAE